MRNFSRTICAAIVAALAFSAAPAIADPDSSATYKAEFERIKQEMRELQLEMHAFHPLPKYCLPPIEPLKAPHNAVMQNFDGRTRELVARYAALKQSLNSFLAGNHEIEKEFMFDGLSPRERRYWKNSPYELERDRLQKTFNQKDAELKAKRERHCGAQTPKKTEEIIGGNPPPVEPPPPPLPPAPPVDPLKGLNRPIPKGVNFPRLERKFYCSQAQKDAALALIPPEIAKVNANIADIDAYIASLNTRRGELKARGVEQHWLDSMDYEVRNAETEKASQATTIQALETTRRLIASTSVVDCSKEGKEIGSLPGTTLDAGVAYGDLTIPKKPYLSLEIGSDLFLGVVDYETEDELLVITGRVDYEFKLGGLPNVKLLGNPGDQRWVTSAELFGYDFSIFSEGRDIDTTTEGVGIPGTGDPMSSFPEGVFFANPAFNDVTDIRYAHDSDFRGGAISLGQKSYHDSHNCYVGVGFGYNRLRTMDVLTGTVDGFLTDFRYETDIATRSTNLFVRGGVEIPLDDFWNQSVRYAGEFSGFRLSAGGEGRVNFLDAEGLDQLDLIGFVSDSQAVRIGKDDTTFSYKLSAGLNYAPTGIKGLDVSLSVEYGESDTHPVAHRSGQTGETTRIEFEQEEVFVGTLGMRLRF